MASEDKGRPLPKFGEWDVNNPNTSEGFTVMFNKARNEKTNGAAVTFVTPRKSDDDDDDDKDDEFDIPKKRAWLCCVV